MGKGQEKTSDGMLVLNKAGLPLLKEVDGGPRNGPCLVVVSDQEHLDHAAVTEIHEALGAWLKANPPRKETGMRALETLIAELEAQCNVGANALAEQLTQIHGEIVTEMEE